MKKKIYFPNFLRNQTNVHIKHNNNKFNLANFNKAYKGAQKHHNNEIQGHRFQQLFPYIFQELNRKNKRQNERKNI